MVRQVILTSVTQNRRAGTVLSTSMPEVDSVVRQSKNHPDDNREHEISAEFLQDNYVGSSNSMFWIEPATYHY